MCATVLCVTRVVVYSVLYDRDRGTDVVHVGHADERRFRDRGRVRLGADGKFGGARRRTATVSRHASRFPRTEPLPGRQR